jgi:hypothetical protein
VKSEVVIGLNAVIVAVTSETPRVLTVDRSVTGIDPDCPEQDPTSSAKLSGLPFGPLDPAQDRTLELGLRRWVREQTGISLGYVEQLYTFGDRSRDPRFYFRGTRVISVAYLALVKEEALTAKEARWRDCYSFLPWEEWREGRPDVLDRSLIPALTQWTESLKDPEARKIRQNRMDLAFGCRGVTWNPEHALDRYELLYEAGLVGESTLDATFMEEDSSSAAKGGELLPGRPTASGETMILDHRRIVATALERLRGKLRYRPLVFELLGREFTLFQLQRLVESLTGVRLHKQNFRRLVVHGGLVEKTGRQFHETGGRPAELFSFRKEALRERPAPGVGLPVMH